MLATSRSLLICEIDAALGIIRSSEYGCRAVASTAAVGRSRRTMLSRDGGHPPILGPWLLREMDVTRNDMGK